MKYSRITGTGSYLPSKILTNFDLEKILDTNDQWIVERTGIHHRHIAEPQESSSTLAYRAAARAVEAAEIDPKNIDLIIVATCTPDKFFPSTACLVQQQLGISAGHCPAFDISAACAGFIYALSVADQFIRTGAVETALVLGSEVMSRIVDWTDRRTCILFGDGAGAVVLQADNNPGVLSTSIQADASHKDIMYIETGLAAKEPLSDSRYVYMQGNEVFRIAVKTLGKIVDDTLKANHLDQSAVRWLIPHQANLRIIQAIAKRLDMSMEQVILTVGEHANTSAASIPLALDCAVRDGRVQRGDLCLLEAFGGGLAWGSALVKY